MSYGDLFKRTLGGHFGNQEPQPNGFVLTRPQFDDWWSEVSGRVWAADDRLRRAGQTPKFSALVEDLQQHGFGVGSRSQPSTQQPPFTLQQTTLSAPLEMANFSSRPDGGVIDRTLMVPAFLVITTFPTLNGRPEAAADADALYEKCWDRVADLARCLAWCEANEVEITD
jgi:hypothetical protein